MKPPLPDSLLDEVHGLLMSCLSGEAKPEDIAYFNDLLLNNEEARSIYTNAIRDSFRLHRWAAAEELRGDGILDESSSDEELYTSRTFSGGIGTSDQPFAVPPLPTTHNPLPANFVGGPVFSYMVASVVLCLLLLGAWAYKVSHVQPFAPRIANSNIPPSPIFVGRITGTKDCQWSDPDTQTVVGASVALDRRYALASGLLEITYKSGARVILEGPCTYRVGSSAGGFLERGKLTANIGGQRSENSPFIPHPSYFVVKTPTAIITDLGTEFGVEVSNEKNTISYVFKGSVRVRTVAEAGGEVREVVLGEHQAASVERHKDGTDLKIIKDASDDETSADGAKDPKKQSLRDRFVRKLPSLDGRKPMASRSNPVPNGGIRIDGKFDDWKGVEPYPDDAPDDATFDPQTSVDLIRGAIAHDQDYFYFFYEQTNPVGILRYVPWVFLDTDKNPRTGRHFSRLEYPVRMVQSDDPWVGGGVRLEGGNRDMFPLPLGAEFNLSGRSNLFVWSPQGYTKINIIDFGTEGIEHAVSEDKRKVEICVPRRLLGGPCDFHVIWIAQNRAESVEGEQGITDFYPDGASDRRIKAYFYYSTKSDHNSDTPSRSDKRRSEGESKGGRLMTK